MVCKYCNTDNPEGASFCSFCGKELKESKVCRHCGAENGPEAMYCCICGKSLEEKPVCPKCGAEINKESNFCIVCGATISNKPDIPKESDISRQVCKIMRVISFSVAILLASLTIIFTIFMGVTVNGVEITLISEGSKFDLFYFFGKAYKDINHVIELGEEIPAAHWIMTILSTLVCATTLITTLTMGIIAIVRSGKAIAGKDNGGSIMAVKSFAAYIIGSMLLLIIWNAKSSNGVYEYSMKLTPVTKVGFTVCGILVGIYTILTVLANGKRQLNKSFIINGSLCIGAIVVSIILIVLCGLPVLSILAGYYKETISHLTFYYLISDYYMDKIAISVFILIAAAAFMYATIRSVIMVSTQIEDLTGGTSNMKGSLSASIEILAASAISLAMTIIAINMFNEWLVDEVTGEAMNISYGNLIALLVVSIISLGIGIARKICLNNFYDDVTGAYRDPSRWSSSKGDGYTNPYNSANNSSIYPQIR